MGLDSVGNHARCFIGQCAGLQRTRESCYPATCDRHQRIGRPSGGQRGNELREGFSGGEHSPVGGLQGGKPVRSRRNRDGRDRRGGRYAPGNDNAGN